MAQGTPAGGTPPRFDPLLPSKPIGLPFQGSYGLLQAVYDLEEVMDLAESYSALVADVQAELHALVSESAAMGEALSATPPAEVPEAEASALHTLAAMQARATVLRRTIFLRVIAKVLLPWYEWPFAGAAPRPADPSDWDRWPTPVLEWLATTGLSKAREQLNGPF